MSDDTIRLVTVGRIIRRRLRLLALLVVLGALAGHGVSLLFPPRYTTSASVLLRGAWQERQLLTQAEIATNSVVLDRVADALRQPGVDGEELRKRVTAKAANGNIITISGTADTPEEAQRLADQAARQFVVFAGQIASDEAVEAADRPGALRRTVTETGRRIEELADAAGSGQSVESVQTRTELAKLLAALQGAVDKLDEAELAVKTDMVVMGPAVRPTGEAPPTRPQLVGAGALLFFLVAVVGHLAAARMSRRPRTEPEIAAAVGAVSLGAVDVPADRRARRRKGGGPRSWLRRLLGVEVRWDAPAPRKGDEAGTRIRYRRVCARLRDRLPGALRLLVVVPEGDAVAVRAAERLVAEAEGDPLLRVVEVSVAQPMLPDREGEAGALVVLSAGDWTAGDLAGVAGACVDAGHEVVGVVLAGTVRFRPARSSGRSRRVAVPDSPVGASVAGGGE
ncbi:MULTISPECIES: Wzz/FepE/Etk N-terminal domain-containing protein [unclassified Streptomyces]|uniref:Wzz/FepE/Etk N-terminal domain-containing protein n=1 Tax=unclassified Streptomyces TaxID=2593676 RepID=UPI00166072EA|nr:MULTISPECIES: Wzz/FepE/Etk N-terminal domain-containing protein [unclassified Streptomyces]MBD0711182.1 polysaccharide biosynthesis protein [Streptomyces sp. CBMA291]MBD0714213.1 polysaccharide biosynthesis protein [Streptomyces sp. CBMA370]